MELNREVGEIKAQVRFMTQEVAEIKADVKSLLAFKWRMLGVAAFVAFVATLLVEIARAKGF
jgi:hypothetical protein